MKQNNRDFSILKQRILQFTESQGIKNSEVYAITGISNGILSQNGGLSEDSLLKFLSFYKNISIDWLLTGEGDMLQNSSEKSTNSSEKCIEKMTNYIEMLEKENKKLNKELEEIKQNKPFTVAPGVGESSLKKEIC